MLFLLLASLAAASTPFPPPPNKPPTFTISQPVVKVKEDAGPQTLSAFIANIGVGDDDNALFLFPGGKQDWWLDISIVSQEPPLPASLFASGPSLTPNMGRCDGSCAVSDTSTCSTTCNPAADRQCDGTGGCIHSGVCTPTAPPSTATGSCSCACACTPAACTPGTTADLVFEAKPDVSGVVELEVVLRDSGGTANGGVDITTLRFTIEIEETNDPASFQLSSKGTRRLEVYEDSCNTITGWVQSFDTGNPFETWSGERLDYQLFPRPSGTYKRSIFRDVPVCDPCTPPPAAPNTNQYQHLDVSFPDGTLSFCMERNVVDTAVVVMTCVDICDVGQSFAPPPGTRTWPCWDQGTYSVCPSLSFEVSIIPVNDPPGTCPDRVTHITVNECQHSQTRKGGCAHSIELYKAGTACCGPGGGEDERGQRVTVKVESEHPSLYEKYPTFDTSKGTLHFTLKEYAYVFGNKDELVLAFHDDGGVQNQWCSGHSGPPCPPGEDSRYCPLTLTIREVNDPPLWTVGKDVVIEEDSGLLVVPGFATHLAAGRDPHEMQQLSFTCTSSPQGVLREEPKIAVPSGTLEVLPAKDAFGTVTVTCSLSDGVDSTPHSFTVDVLPVNDCPWVNISAEISGLQGLPFARVVATPNPGAANEMGQSFRYDVWVHPRDSMGRLFARDPTIDSNGNLTFLCAEVGSTTVRVTVRDDGGDSPPHCGQGSPVDVSIHCLPPNQPPRFSLPQTEVEAWETEGAVMKPRFATAIDKGHFMEGNQSLSFTLTGYNVSLFAEGPKLDPNTGTLTFKTELGRHGTTEVVAVLSDDGGGDPPNKNTSAPKSFRITIKPETDPTFVPGGVVNVLEDSGDHALLWATQVNPGGLLPYTFELSPSCSLEAFQAPPVVEVDPEGLGVLKFTLLPNGNGKTTEGCRVCIVNARSSTCHSLTIEVHPENDPPVFTVVRPSLVTEEDSGVVVFRDVFGNVTAGPPDENRTQQVTWKVRVLKEDQLLVQYLPTVVDGRHLQVETAPDAWGSVDLEVTATDASFSTRPKSTRHTVRLVVNPVNDPPFFTPGGNVTVALLDGDVSTKWAIGVSAGAPDEDISQTVRFSARWVDGDEVVAGLAVAPDGTLSFTPVLAGWGAYEVVLSDDYTNPANSSPHKLAVTVLGEKALSQPTWTSVRREIHLNEDTEGSFLIGTVGGWSPQLVTNVVVLTNPALFSTPPEVTWVNSSGGANASLVVRPAANRFGVGTIEVALQDHTTRLPAETFAITVRGVNDPPTFTVVERHRVLHFSALPRPTAIKGWAPPHLITPGPFEVRQGVSFVASAESLGPFPRLPSVDKDGTLHLPQANVHGTAVVPIFAEDDGSLADDSLGGVQRSAPVKLLVTVSAEFQMLETNVPHNLTMELLGAVGNVSYDPWRLEVERAALEERLRTAERVGDNTTASKVREQLALLTDTAMWQGGVLTLSRENTFVAHFRDRVAGIASVSPDEVSVADVRLGDNGGVSVRWGLVSKKAVEAFVAQHSGSPLNNTTLIFMTPVPEVLSSRSPLRVPEADEGTSSTAIALIVVLVVLAVVCWSGMLWFVYKQRQQTQPSQPLQKEVSRASLKASSDAPLYSPPHAPHTAESVEIECMSDGEPVNPLDIPTHPARVS